VRSRVQAPLPLQIKCLIRSMFTMQSRRCWRSVCPRFAHEGDRSGMDHAVTSAALRLRHRPRWTRCAGGAGALAVEPSRDETRSAAEVQGSGAERLVEELFQPGDSTGFVEREYAEYGGVDRRAARFVREPHADRSEHLAGIGQGLELHVK
jgi:hypothetical protein